MDLVEAILANGYTGKTCERNRAKTAGRREQDRKQAVGGRCDGENEFLPEGCRPASWVSSTAEDVLLIRLRGRGCALPDTNSIAPDASPRKGVPGLYVGCGPVPAAITVNLLESM
jgi:hypothetical protein